MNSDKDIPLLSSIYKSKHTGRASASTRKKGSITVEAAMAVPIFFFATLALVLLLELLSVQTAVRSGLQEAGKKLAVQAVEVPAVIPSNLERDVVNSIGAERLERSIVEGGSSGINCNQSYLSPFTGIGEIQASYQVRIPVPGFSIAPISYKETMRIKAWTGYEAGGFGEEDDQIVYVTDTGVVYLQVHGEDGMELYLTLGKDTPVIRRIFIQDGDTFEYEDYDTGAKIDFVPSY